MRARRILVTGSRDFTDYHVIARELVRYISENARMHVDSQGFPVDWNTDGWVIVHGDCPTGADHLASEYAITNWIEQEPHPANWKRYGKAAGFQRNSEMVDAGADVVLAFTNPCRVRGCTRQPPGHISHGTADTIRKARDAGIEVRIFTEEGTL